jgi:hypothetical protein
MDPDVLRRGNWIIRSQQTAEPDFCCGFLRKPHEGTFGMVAAWTFEGPLSVLRAMGLNTRRHHHRPALWARWPFSGDRSGGCEPETEHVIFLSCARALPKSQVPPEITSIADAKGRRDRQAAWTHSPVCLGTSQLSRRRQSSPR